MAVFVYFGRDIVDIIESTMKFDFKSQNGRLGILVIIATIPAAILGYLFRDVFVFAFDNILITGIGFGVTSLLLFISSFDFEKEKKDIPSFRDSVAIGIAQVFALFPGVSRSGSTLSVGLLSGLKEKSALKFSFLMSIPIIFGANVFELGNKSLPGNMIWATIVSFAVGLLTIHILYNFVLTSKKILRYFAAYAMLLFLFILIIHIF
jgi:undecaprenyl-diphosphatase